MSDSPPVLDALQRQIAELVEQVAVITRRQIDADRKTAMLADGMDAVESSFEEIASLTASSAAVPATDADDIATLEPPDLTVLIPWVDNHVTLLVQRKVSLTGASGGVDWCRMWWKHPEAIARLHALNKPGSISSPKMGRPWELGSVSSSTRVSENSWTPWGPFYDCKPDEHKSTKVFGKTATLGEYEQNKVPAT